MARSHPRISLLKLAEYVRASAVRRRSIVLAQAHPSTPVVAQYRRADTAVAAFLGRGGNDLRTLESTIEELSATKPTSDWDARDLENSVAALQHFVGLLPQLDFEDRLIRMPRNRGASWISGVEVSVAPAAIVRRRGDEVTIGAIKVAYSKSRPLPAAEGEYAATILRGFLEERVRGTAYLVAPSLCQVVDVFSGRIHAAPSAHKRRMEEVSAACAEIASVWPSAAFDTVAVQPVA